MSYSNAPWPLYEEDEIAAVETVLRSGKVNYWTGSIAREFEKAYAEYVGVPHAIAVANGTVALDLAWKALGIGVGDEVVVTARTFLASVSSIVLAGATPVFADIDPDSQNITPETVRAVLTPRTRAILCVHLAGWPCDMDGMRMLADAHGLRLVEDCAQAHGARYRGQAVGSIGDIGAFSFCQDKIMSTGGEGGLVTCRDPELWSRMWSFKDHGKSFDAVYHREHAPGFRWLHESFGTNWRITEMQAAIGLRQLAKLDDWVSRRRANAEALFHELSGLDALRTPQPPSDLYHAAYRAYAFVRPEALKPDWSRDRIMQAIAAAGVPCMSGSCSEVYREKAFDGTGWRPAQPLPVAHELGETSLAFLVHHTLSPADLRQVGRIAHDIILNATR
ncbi:MAG TPA: DegT/DnrJ/EryC1/StrS aminotransferase family protein [Moraxellaceae bacterium]|nr:DegT/DnrJ/EryC1/StrS aminotransferase family protein [Moraxellaceae bacterium]